MDIDTIQTLLVKVAIFSPIVIGLVSVARVSGVPARWLPLTSLIIGMIFGVLFVAFSLLGLLCGIALGLSAVGLYEFGRTTVAGKGVQ
jgi:hypothetical protein